MSSGSNEEFIFFPLFFFIPEFMKLIRVVRVLIRRVELDPVLSQSIAEARSCCANLRASRVRENGNGYVNALVY